MVINQSFDGAFGDSSDVEAFLLGCGSQLVGIMVAHAAYHTHGIFGMTVGAQIDAKEIAEVANY